MNESFLPDSLQKPIYKKMAPQAIEWIDFVAPIGLAICIFMIVLMVVGCYFTIQFIKDINRYERD